MERCTRLGMQTPYWATKGDKIPAKVQKFTRISFEHKYGEAQVRRSNGDGRTEECHCGAR